MKIKVQLEGEESVTDWSKLRDSFQRAAEENDLVISIIVHTDEELG